MKFSHKNRKIGYTYGSLSGVFSFRGEKSISFESSLERDLLRLLEFNESVIDVIEQPFTIEYINKNNRPTTYTPDFLVNFAVRPSSLQTAPDPKPLIIEVKPRGKIIKNFDILRPKFRVGLRFAKENDMNFRIYDESRIRTLEFQNINFLSQYKRREYDPFEEDRILNHLKDIGHTSIDYLLAHLYVTKEDRGIALAQIWHLISVKKLGCDIGRPLNQSTAIWLNIDQSYLEGVYYDD